jgi:nucleoside-diphosphate-sugar epimerase
MIDWAGRTALVTGGAGFIGSHLVDRLVDEGARVRVLDDFSTGNEANLTRSAEAILVHRGDLRDADAVRGALSGCDAVFHLAAIPSVPRSVDDPELTHAVNVTGTLALLEACREVGVRRLVFAASCAAYGNDPTLPKAEGLAPHPESPYASQKLMCEEYCRLYSELYGLETVSLRFFNVFGPRQSPESDYAAAVPRFVKACIDEKPITVFGDGEQTRDFVYVEDVAAACLLAADAQEAIGQVINIAGGRRVSVNDIVSTVKRLTDCDIETSYLDERSGDVRHSQADVAKAIGLLRFVPEVDLETGLERTIAHFRSPEEMT